MKYLVLGSSGQIGGSLVSYLEKQGHQVIPHDIKRFGDEDLRQKSWILDKKMYEADFVYFLAWDVGGSKYLSAMENTYEFIHNNFKIMKNVFECLKLFKKPFIFVSSQMSLLIHSSYGNLKLVGEKFSDSLGGLSIRLWNVFGREQEEEKSHVITDFIKMAKEDGIIKMRTAGNEERQFLYVDDCCDIMYDMSLRYEFYKSIDSCFDISSFKWTTIENVAKAVSKIYNCSYVKGTLVDKVQQGHKIDPNKRILSYWKPKISLEEGIRLLGDLDV